MVWRSAAARDQVEIERIRALFLAARRHRGPARAAFLVAHAGARSREVEALLAVEDAGTGLLAQPPGRAVLSALAAPALPVALAPVLAPGDRLGEFVVIDVIGRGGSSVVYRALQLSVRRAVALKVIATADRTPSELSRARRELHIAAVFDHENLVTMYTAGEDAARGVIYSAMRLIDGPSLADVLVELVHRGAPPDIDERRALAARVADVARALGVLHGAGMLHRDVKPANVVLEPVGPTPADTMASGSDSVRVDAAGAVGTRSRLALAAKRAVLVDFGLARPAAAPPSTVAGTLPYMAPETLQGRQSDASADVFALGLVLFDLLVARDGGARTPASPPPSLRAFVPDIERDLDAIVAMATAEKPVWRYRDGAALAADLDAFVAGGPVAARQLGVVAGAVRATWRHRKRIRRACVFMLVAAMVTLGVVVGVGYPVGAGMRLHAARAALARGDLGAVAGLLAQLPAFAARAGMPAIVFDDAALRDVLWRLRAGERAGAELRAAAYVDDAGWSAHPVLVAFLVDAIARGESVSWTALATVARLCLEHPNESEFDAAATRDLRNALCARVRTQGVEVDPFVFTALTGCGDASAVGDLIDWLTQAAGVDAATAATELHRERVRLAYVALHGIAVRAPRCGDERGLSSSPARSLASAAAPLAALEFRPDETLDPRGTYYEFVIALAALHRRAGRPLAVADLPSLGPLPMGLCGVLRAPSLRGRIAALIAGPAADKLIDGLGEVGFAVAMQTDAAFTAQVRAQLAPAIAAVGHERRCWGAFDAGFAGGHRLLDGACGIADIDPETRLRQELHPEASRVRALEIESVDPSPGRVVAQLDDGRLLARWNLGRLPVEVWGAVEGVDVVNAEPRVDACAPNFVNVALAPTASAVRLRFRVDGKPHHLRLEVQKAMRGPLPWGGVAELVVEVGGQRATFEMGGRSTVSVFVLALDEAAARAGVVTIKLGPESNTTVIVCGAELRE